ncbi:MAG: xanthine dehydrogenase family protein molybdopterin-binding subunit [Nitrospinota bacterium]
MPEGRFSHIGKPTVKPDSWDKALGRTLFGDDLSLHRPLFARVLRAYRSPARILSIDTREAKKVPGVRAVMTARDIPGKNRGRFPDFPALAGERVRYFGEALALVAAETPEAAEKALERIRVSYREVREVYEVTDSGAPVVKHFRVSKGNVEKALRESAFIVENTYRTGFAEHGFIEPEAGSAWMDEAGVVNVRVPTQEVEIYRIIAEVLGIPASRVRVVSPFVGGAFGGKEHPLVGIYLALLAFKTGRPLRMALGREETMAAGSKKHPFLIKYKSGADRHGHLTACLVEMLTDSGGYLGATPTVALGAMVAATGPYRVPNVLVDVKAIRTGNPFTEAMRGIGANQVAFAYESQMDALAEEIGMDPLELRRRNYLTRGDTLATGQKIETHVALKEAAEKAFSALGKKAEGKGSVRVGRGLAANLTGYGRPFQRAEARIALEPDGTATLYLGVSDLGGGQSVVFRQVAAEVLGVPLERVSIYIADSAHTPHVGLTAGSRQTFLSGRAVEGAAGRLKRNLLMGASQLLEAREEDLALSEGRIFVRSAPGRSVELSEVVSRLRELELPLAENFTFESPRHSYPGQERYGGMGGWCDYTFGAHAAEVAVDLDTGEIRVLKLVACHDVGRAINPLNVEGQIEGGAAMALGYALQEEVLVKEGRILTPSLAEYLLPTSLDVPDIEPVILESGEGLGPFGSRGIGEPACVVSSAAIGNAVRDAIGVAVKELPMTPERVLRALGRLSLSTPKSI